MMNRLRYLLFIALQMGALLSFSQSQNMKFLHLGIEDGLSQNTVYCILQDKQGFMWIGTPSGLNKYDGYGFTVYRKNAKDQNSLSSNGVRDMVEDAEGNIWIATDGGGLNMLDRAREKFICYKHDDNNANSIAHNYINSLALDSKGCLWIATNGTGLDRFDIKNKVFTHYTHDSDDPKSINDNYVYRVFEDSRHNLWIGTTHGGLNLLDEENKTFTPFLLDKRKKGEIGGNMVTVIFEDSNKQLWLGTSSNGINLFDRNTHEFLNFKHDPLDNNSLPNNSILSIKEDSKGSLWIGTENGGLSILNVKTKTFQNYQQDDIDKASLSSNSIWSIYKDVKGNMWVGTFSGGINFFNLDANKFAHYRHTESEQSLSNNTVFSIIEDTKNNIWIATDGGGLNMMDSRTGVCKHYKHENGNKKSLSGNNILKVYEDHEGNLWAGTWGEGITVFNPEKNSYRFYKNDPLNSKSLSSNNIWTFFEDADYNMWIGTFGEGLERYDRKHDNFIHYRHDDFKTGTISDNTVRAIQADDRGNLWIGTTSGLNLFNTNTQTFKHYKSDNNKNSISADPINYIFYDKDQGLWIATDMGLCNLDINTNHFTNYHAENGLPGEAIFGIEKDDHGNLWVSTNNGLSKFNPATKIFKNFSIADGLQSPEFKQACYRSRTGKMYFGGINGFNAFFPDSIKDNSYNPSLVLTGFQIFNKPITLIKDRAGTEKNINEINEIVLSYTQSVISFEFASLNYTTKDKRRYAYILEGFDNGWNYVGIQHSATYTNLDPGEYVFKVKGLDNEGNWSDKMLNVKLSIRPPFWQEWWFRILSTSLILGCLVAFFRIREVITLRQKKVLVKLVDERTQQLAFSSQEERHARLEAEKARIEAEQANNAKSVFLATMSHEIRTPMNGVIGMASLLAETKQTLEQQEYTETIRSCGENLLTVINDVLDFSKIESGKMELENKDFDLRACIEEVLDVFADKAAKLNLDLIYEIDYNVPSQIVGDSLRLRQVLMNLIGNAIKFTLKGEIFLGVHLLNANGNQLQLGFEIRDTGIGISQDKLDRLFKAFSQVDSSTTRQYGGTGLGLVICEKLIELMGGNITVESYIGQGTTFSFTIHCGISSQNTRTYIHHNISGIEGKKVLVIDDNKTNLTIIKNELKQWNLITSLAGSGEEALGLLSQTKDFDLVITDMQMPLMDGVQLAKHIRQQYADIPIILLSSVGDDRPKEQTGLFNSILTKPVRQSILRKHILIHLKQLDRAMVEEKEEKKKLSIEFAQQFPLRILITEDNPVNQKLAERVLTKLGYKPAQAFNGREALDALDKNDFDIIFMDIQMPVMDGMEATQKIRLRSGVQPVIIAMTANAMQGDREKCIAAGMNDYISKPIKLENLVTLIEVWASQINNQVS